jgi:hypothetical protein
MVCDDCVRVMPPTRRRNAQVIGRSGPSLASISIFLLGSMETNVVAVSLIAPSALWRKRNVVPGPVGPSGVLVTDSTLGSVFRAFLSRSRKKRKTTSTGCAIVTVDSILAIPISLCARIMAVVGNGGGERRSDDDASVYECPHRSRNARRLVLQLSTRNISRRPLSTRS